ncbi:DinB family protein [Dyadobacter flavalbus]|uniref:DinB family protein n=1 Tax=Dyadobacter flavalbus TaxID=2579942 RepID=A0A5M8Q6I6_9BACT|nr:DinB family protein [Dyadobacter flavalbus]KAA6431507.1 DinB family protein [Dyadobacter flavalbus]
MKNNEKPEVWLRGPLAEIPDLLQPVAHALLQAQEEITVLVQDFPDELLWEKPAGVASAGFHLQHMAGVLDRLFTYARGESLLENQLAYLKAEGNPPFPGCTAADLLKVLDDRLLSVMQQLKQTDESTLKEVRYVGRAGIPSTHLGLLFHAAEHTQRHLGQLLVTARILTSA